MIQRIARKYPLLNGCGRIANAPLIRSWIDSSNGEHLSGRLTGGATFMAPSADHVSRAAWLFGDLDPKLTLLASLLVREGDHVVDIGANFGLFSLQIGRLVGPAGRVDAVEPQPLLAAMLRTSRTMNGWPHIRVHETALGMRNAVGMLSVPSGNSGAASLIRRRETDSKIPVLVENSGSFLSKLDGGHIRFLKIDAEGAESDIIAGGLSFFRNHRPDVVFFEAQKNQRYEGNASISLLTECGYACYPVLPSMRRLRLAKPEFRGDLEGVHDILAIAPGVIGQDIRQTLHEAGVRFIG